MKNKHSMWAGSILLLGVLGTGIYGMGVSIASSKYDRGHERSERHDYYRSSGRTELRQDPLYEEECGSCHMAYPAGLLPADGWQKNLQNLDDHYGENAEVDDATLQQLQQYLVVASQQRQGDYRKMFRNLGSEIPARITELPYFRHEHDEIPLRYVSGNDKVGSFSQCNACHKRAQQGDFDEDNVDIPGLGRWDD